MSSPPLIYEALPTRHLLELLSQHGLSLLGHKGELIWRLREFDKLQNEVLDNNNDPDGKMRRARLELKFRLEISELKKEVEKEECIGGKGKVVDKGKEQEKDVEVLKSNGALEVVEGHDGENDTVTELTNGRKVQAVEVVITENLHPNGTNLGVEVNELGVEAGLIEKEKTPNIQLAEEASVPKFGRHICDEHCKTLEGSSECPRRLCIVCRLPHFEFSKACPRSTGQEKMYAAFVRARKASEDAMEPEIEVDVAESVENAGLSSDTLQNSIGELRKMLPCVSVQTAQDLIERCNGNWEQAVNLHYNDCKSPGKQDNNQRTLVASQPGTSVASASKFGPQAQPTFETPNAASIIRSSFSPEPDASNSLFVPRSKPANRVALRASRTPTPGVSLHPEPGAPRKDKGKGKQKRMMAESSDEDAISYVPKKKHVQETATGGPVVKPVVGPVTKSGRHSQPNRYTGEGFSTASSFTNTGEGYGAAGTHMPSTSSPGSLEDIKEVSSLPAWAKTSLKLPKILEFPAVRALDLRDGENLVDIEHHGNRRVDLEAMLAQRRGEEAAEECTRCQKVNAGKGGKGGNALVMKFEKCVVLKGHFNGACCNCQWGGRGSKCNLYQQPGKKEQK